MFNKLKTSVTEHKTSDTKHKTEVIDHKALATEQNTSVTKHKPESVTPTTDAAQVRHRHQSIYSYEAMQHKS